MQPILNQTFTTFKLLISRLSRHVAKLPFLKRIENPTRRTNHLIIELTTTPVVLVNGWAPAFAPFIWRTYAVMFTVVSSFMSLNWKFGSLTVI